MLRLLRSNPLEEPTTGIGNVTEEVQGPMQSTVAQFEITVGKTESYSGNCCSDLRIDELKYT